MFVSMADQNDMLMPRVKDRNMSPNVTYLTPPQERAFTLGINMSF